MQNSIKGLRAQGASLLKKAQLESYAFECDILLAYVLQKTKLFLLTYPDFELSQDEVSIFNSFIARRCNYEPLQYITEHQEFMGIDFRVSPDVLIPRQDTEILVETLLEMCGNKNASILDLCSGSGCIGVSAAFYLKKSTVTLSDISEKAICLGKINASSAKVIDRTNFFVGDLFDPFSNVYFDYIVSNPPYIPQEDIASLHPQVKDFEPTIALSGGFDGLDFYRRIIDKAPFHLLQNGILLLEVGINQAIAVSQLMEKNFAAIHFVKDLSSIDRVVYGITNSL